MVAAIEKMEFLCTLFNKFLPSSPEIEILAKSLLESKEEVRIFSPKNDEIDLEKYFRRTIRSLKNFGRH